MPSLSKRMAAMKIFQVVPEETGELRPFSEKFCLPNPYRH